MKVIKATDSAVNAIRKMDAVSRSLISSSAKKQSFFIAEGSYGYQGPFMAKWIFKDSVQISCPPEFMGGNTQYCGSICAPDMQILAHISSNWVTFVEGQENTLLVLRVIWGDSGVSGYIFDFVPDPWKSCSDAMKLAAVDHLNPKTEEYPYRDPYISIYPIARIEGTKIVQIQQGHIVEYNRWWRS